MVFLCHSHLYPWALRYFLLNLVTLWPTSPPPHPALLPSSFCGGTKPHQQGSVMDVARQESGVLMSFQHLVKGKKKKTCEKKNEKWVWEKYKQDKWRKECQKPYVLIDSSCGHESLISRRCTALSYLYAFILSYYLSVCWCFMGDYLFSMNWDDHIWNTPGCVMTVNQQRLCSSLYLRRTAASVFSIVRV